jgi:hypothetical protein
LETRSVAEKISSLNVFYFIPYKLQNQSESKILVCGDSNNTIISFLFTTKEKEYFYFIKNL